MTALLDRKDITASRLVGLPGEAPEPKTYRQTVLDARRAQLALTRDNLRRLAETYDRAAQAIVDRVKALPRERRGRVWLQAQFDLLRSIDEEMDRLRREYGDLLEGSMLASAQQAADREAEVARLIEAPTDPRLAATLEQTVTLASGSVTVRYGSLARGAVEAAARRYYSDGLRLSDRLASLDTETRKLIEDILTQGIAEGTSAYHLARQMRGALMAAGEKNPRTRANLIARTEINNAFREGTIRSATLDDGVTLKPYISAIGWRLSASHTELDRCDLYAEDDTGLGPGNYLPGDVPLGHPRCVCVVTEILVAYPDEQFVRKEPDAAGVRRSEVVRLAAEDDPVARRWLARYGGGEE